MALRYHATSFILSRARLFPDFLAESNRKPWIAGFIEEAGEHAWDEDLPHVFVPHLGSLQSQPPQRQYSGSQYPRYRLSKIRAAPFYVRCNWQIKAAQVPPDATLQLRLRLRFYEHGGASCAIYGLMLSQAGVPHQALVDMLRGLADSPTPNPVILQCRTAANRFEGTAGEVMDSALAALESGILKQPDRAPDQVLQPDHLTVDLGRTTPAVAIDQSPPDLLRLLALTADEHRVMRHKREPELGLFDFDWIAASAKQLLFCNTQAPWPGTDRWRSLRRHGRATWQLYRVAEMVRVRLLWARFLRHQFEDSSLQMIRAHNISEKFIKTLLKTTYYDDRLYTLAADLKTTDLHSRDAVLYAHLAQQTGLDLEIARLDEAAGKFIAQVEAWAPGLTKFIDLFKTIFKA
jgi:hypothetical protein